MNKRAGQAIAIAVGIGLMVFILWMPRQPEAVVNTIPPMQEPLTDDPVDRAVQLVSGPNPMEGILALRELATQETPNVDAVVWLGIFGVESGQLDKARQRFSEALTLEPEHVEATWQLALLDMEEGIYDRAVVGFESCMDSDSTYANGLFFTARCYEAMGKMDAAVIRYNEFLPYAPDTVISQQVRAIIERLESGSIPGTNEIKS